LATIFSAPHDAGVTIVLALVSAIVYGVSDYCGGRAARSAPVLLVTLVSLGVGLGVSSALVGLGSDPFPPGGDVAWGVAAGVMSLTGGASFYFALANGAMTIVAPVTAIVSAVVPVSVGVISGERPSVLAVSGIVMALVAVALVSGIAGRADQATPLAVAVMAVVAGVGFGLLFVFLDRTSDESGWWPIVIGQVTSISIVATIVLVRRRPLDAPSRTYGLAALAGATAVAANVCYVAAAREGLLSIVAVITSMYPATTVGLATRLDGERVSRSQTVGLVGAVVALAMVTAGS